MSNIKTKQLGIGVSLIIVLLSFGVFASVAALITKNQFSLAPFTLADENDEEEEEDEDEPEDEEEDEDEGEDEDKAEEEAKKQAERERERAKKQAEYQREKAKKQAEYQRESAKKQLETSGQGWGGSELDDEEKDDSMEDIDEDDEASEHGMYKDRDKTLEKLRKEIAEARKEILEKQAEGVDVTAALARLSLAESSLTQTGASFDANDLVTAKMLAKQIKKTAHFAKKDLHNAEKIADEIAKVEKRFGQVAEKIATFQSLGGDASVFVKQLDVLRSDFSALKNLTTSTPGALTRDTVKAFEKKVKRLKSLVESSIFALGGTEEDDDLFEDYEDDAEDLFEDMDDVAEIEDGDDNAVSVQARKVASEHKVAAKAIKKSLQDIKDRDGFTKTLFGPDVNALETLNAEVSAINARATALELATAQVTDPDVKQILGSQASALRGEAMKLQAYVTAEHNTFSLFGWFAKLF